MADPIDLEFRVVNAEQAAQQVEHVAEATGHVKTQATQATPAVERMTRATRDMGQQAERTADNTEDAWKAFQELGNSGRQVAGHMGQVAHAFNELATITGNETVGLVASIASTTAQFAAMGAMLGPTGAVVGGVIGLGTALYGLVNAHDDAADAANDQADAIDNVADSVVGLGEVMLEWRDTLGIENAVRSGGDALTGLSSGALSAELRTREARLMELRVANAESGALVRSEEEQRLTREVEGLRAEIDRRAAPTDRPSRGGRAAEDTPDRVPNSIDAMNERDDARMDREMEAYDEAVAAVQRYHDLAREEYEIQEEKQHAILELEREGYEARAEAEQEYQDHLREMADEERDNRKAEYEREHEEAIQRQQELMGMGMQASKMLVNAIGDVISGAKSGEEAFLGLLKGFLEMISEYAILSATREFADAISSFASQNYAGGAQHLAAGIAFVGLAAATGIGAAAIQVPSGAQAPARPEPQKAEGGGGGTSYVINWNSPVVTAGTRSELGRELTGLISEAEAA